jgi:hypothetical protein
MERNNAPENRRDDDDDDHRDDEGSKILWNVGQFLPDHRMQHPKRQVIFKLATVPHVYVFMALHLDQELPYGPKHVEHTRQTYCPQNTPPP